jgi:putative ABC transport system ATP-binding protein
VWACPWARRAGVRHGPLGLGEVHPAHAGGRARLADGGEVVLEGIALSSLSTTAVAEVRRRSVGYVFQDVNLIPALTAVENVALPAELDGTSGRVARKEALAALEEVGIAELADPWGT